MPWSTQPSGLFVGAGVAVQVTYSFGGAWSGAQYAVPVLDLSDGGIDLILAAQWQGTGTATVFGGSDRYYALGVYNSSASNVWFHLEGGSAL